MRICMLKLPLNKDTNLLLANRFYAGAILLFTKKYTAVLIYTLLVKRQTKKKKEESAF